jgi:beta-carotene ketolase (CrtW type)
VAFNVLKVISSETRIWLFFVAPPVLSSLQLFLFGTYLPHRSPTAKMAPHHARTQRTNHLWAMLSCYFFGYHWEHHQFPHLPWWQLWRTKSFQTPT